MTAGVPTKEVRAKKRRSWWKCGVKAVMKSPCKGARSKGQGKIRLYKPKQKTLPKLGRFLHYTICIQENPVRTKMAFDGRAQRHH